MVKKLCESKSIKAIEVNSGRIIYYSSMYAANIDLNIDVGSISRCSRGKQKTCKSKNNYEIYRFELIEKEESSDGAIKSENLKERSNDKVRRERAENIKKWRNKELKCPQCDRTIKNSYKNEHIYNECINRKKGVVN